jgi:hypothetical protein
MVGFPVPAEWRKQNSSICPAKPPKRTSPEDKDASAVIAPLTDSIPLTHPRHKRDFIPAAVAGFQVVRIIEVKQ